MIVFDRDTKRCQYRYSAIISQEQQQITENIFQNSRVDKSRFLDYNGSNR